MWLVQGVLGASLVQAVLGALMPSLHPTHAGRSWDSLFCSRGSPGGDQAAAWEQRWDVGAVEQEGLLAGCPTASTGLGASRTLYLAPARENSFLQRPRTAAVCGELDGTSQFLPQSNVVYLVVAKKKKKIHSELRWHGTGSCSRGRGMQQGQQTQGGDRHLSPHKPPHQQNPTAADFGAGRVTLE